MSGPRGYPITETLNNRHQWQAKPSGLIYTHRITDNRMSDPVCRNLDMLVSCVETKPLGVCGW